MGYWELIDDITQSNEWPIDNTAMCFLYGHDATEEWCHERGIIKLANFVLLCEGEQAVSLKLAGYSDIRIRTARQVIELIDKFHDECENDRPERILSSTEKCDLLDKFYDNPWGHIRVMIR